jgi:hypothetical protein
MSVAIGRATFINLSDRNRRSNAWLKAGAEFGQEGRSDRACSKTIVCLQARYLQLGKQMIRPKCILDL